MVKEEIYRDMLYWLPFLILMLIVAITFKHSMNVMLGTLLGIIIWALLSLWSQFVYRITKR